MTPGTILCDPNFEFLDGARGRKLIVLLNEGDCGDFIIVKTTSKDRLYEVTSQCQVTHRFPNFFVPKYAQVFDKHTWIQLDEFYPYNKHWLSDKIVLAEIWQVGHMGVLTKDLLSCARDAEDLPTNYRAIIAASLVKISSPVKA